MDLRGQSILYYDGECILCSRFIRFLKKRKNFRNVILYTTDQLPDPKTAFLEMWPDSIVYFKEGQWYIYSDAILQIFNSLGGVWKFVNIFKIVPKSVRDVLYQFFAKHRYSIFGKVKHCELPEKTNSK
jgi:predicted DCC family thiol-disulfide oxidoreductase YuxK